MASLIRYTNQGAVRSRPVSDRLARALEAAARAAGIDEIRVFSGGQPSSGPNRTGSHRHDLGNAGDINLIVGGRTLDFRNPQDRQRVQAFVSAAKAAGVTGIGAGVNYMGPTSIHVGFGTPAVWGAQGRTANAPSWLVEAYNGSAPPAQMAASAPDRDTVRLAQRALNRQGYRLKEDGISGPLTQAALAEFAASPGGMAFAQQYGRTPQRREAPQMQAYAPQGASPAAEAASALAMGGEPPRAPAPPLQRLAAMPGMPAKNPMSERFDDAFSPPINLSEIVVKPESLAAPMQAQTLPGAPNPFPMLPPSPQNPFAMPPAPAPNPMRQDQMAAGPVPSSPTSNPMPAPQRRDARPETAGWKTEPGGNRYRIQDGLVTFRSPQGAEKPWEWSMPAPGLLAAPPPMPRPDEEKRRRGLAGLLGLLGGGPGGGRFYGGFTNTGYLL